MKRGQFLRAIVGTAVAKIVPTPNRAVTTSGVSSHSPIGQFPEVPSMRFQRPSKRLRPHASSRTSESKNQRNPSCLSVTCFGEFLAPATGTNKIRFFRMHRLRQLFAELNALSKRISDTHDHEGLLRCQKELQLMHRLIEGELEVNARELADGDRQIAAIDTDELRAVIADATDPSLRGLLGEELLRREAPKSWLQ